MERGLKYGMKKGVLKKFTKIYLQYLHDYTFILYRVLIAHICSKIGNNDLVFTLCCRKKHYYPRIWAGELYDRKKGANQTVAIMGVLFL